MALDPGPDDFRAEERLEEAFQQVEHFERKLVEGGAEEVAARLERARQEWHDAFVASANISRAMQSVSYDDVVTAEERKRVRRDYLRHPIRTWKREQRNRKVRRASLKSSGPGA